MKQLVFAILMAIATPSPEGQTIEAGPASIVPIMASDVLNQPCNEGEYRRTSQLCAQWAAVDVAGEAKWWAVAGAAISAFALLAALYSVRLARITGHRELRAYLSIRDVKLKLDRSQVDFTIKNHGQTPAFDTQAFASILVDDVECAISPQAVHANGIIDPGEPSINCPGFSPSGYVECGSLRKAVEVHIKLFYRDAVSSPTSRRYFREAKFRIQPLDHGVLPDCGESLVMHGYGSSTVERRISITQYYKEVPPQYLGAHS